MYRGVVCFYQFPTYFITAVPCGSLELDCTHYLLGISLAIALALIVKLHGVYNDTHFISSLLRPMQGQPNALNSAFHLTYNMVLNLLRVEEINPEYMLERSFYQFQNNTAMPVKQQSEWEVSVEICCTSNRLELGPCLCDLIYRLQFLSCGVF